MSLSALASLGALPPLPDGAHLALSAPGWGRGVGTGGRVWPASEVLCHVLQTELSADASVLELGLDSLALAELARVAKPGTPVVVSDEQLQAGITDPYRRAMFALVTFYDDDPRSPVDLVPPGAVDVRDDRSSDARAFASGS